MNINLFRVTLAFNVGRNEEPAQALDGTVRLDGLAWDEVNKKGVQVSVIPYQL